MANIDEEEEEIVVEEPVPPKRKKIATLKVWGHYDEQKYTWLSETMNLPRAEMRILASSAAPQGNSTSLTKILFYSTFQ